MSNPFVEKALGASFAAPANCVRMLTDCDANPDPTITSGTWSVQTHPRTGSVITDDFLRVQLSAVPASALQSNIESPSKILGSQRETTPPQSTAMLRDVFALGDCAIIDGTEYPATAQVASQKASWLAKKLNRGDINTKGFSFVS
jgi:NADH dehydrogenase